MKITNSFVALGLITFFHTSTVNAAVNCNDTAARLTAELNSSLNIAKSQLGLVIGIYNSATKALKKCPHTAQLWYLTARCTELDLYLTTLNPAVPNQPYSSNSDQTLANIQEAVHQAPNSAAVLTVLARINHDTVTAKRAYELDHNYAPARRVYALALAKTGDYLHALSLIPNTKNATGSDLLTRARIYLAKGEPRKAATEARKALSIGGDMFNSYEPTLALHFRGECYEVLGFALLASKQSKASHKALREAANYGSIAAREELAKKHK